jgi:hypothetical protein
MIHVLIILCRANQLFPILRTCTCSKQAWYRWATSYLAQRVFQTVQTLFCGWCIYTTHTVLLPGLLCHSFYLFTVPSASTHERECQGVPSSLGMTRQTTLVSELFCWCHRSPASELPSHSFTVHHRFVHLHHESLEDSSNCVFFILFPFLSLSSFLLSTYLSIIIIFLYHYHCHLVKNRLR